MTENGKLARTNEIEIVRLPEKFADERKSLETVVLQMGFPEFRMHNADGVSRTYRNKRTPRENVM